MEVVAGSLHEWLMQSHYVWGRDQTAAVVGRKKCRAHRKGSPRPENSDEHSDGTRSRSSGKRGSRRQRRWLNDQLLRDLTPPMEAADIESLFAPPPWGDPRIVTPLERVVGGGSRGSIDKAGWEPFRNVDMDAQAKWIHVAEQPSRMKASGGARKQTPAMEAWKGIERNAREALRRSTQSPLLQALEEKLLIYLSEVDGRENEEELALETEASYHRLLLHGLTQFHGLVSRTLPITSECDKGKTQTADRSLIMIKKRNGTNPRGVESSMTSERSLNLIEFLREVQRHTPVAAVA